MRWSSLLCLVHIVFIVQGQMEGDVRLMDDGAPTFEGVLQVYTQNKWNIVCNNRGYTNDDRGAAAACRQLGYATYLEWGSAMSLRFDVDSSGNNYQQTAINGIRCPNVINLVTEAEVFLLRCDMTPLIDSSTCDPQTIVGVICDTSIKNYYDGQVRLQNSMQYDSNHEQSDAHLLEIYLDQDWRPVCVNSGDVNKVFADSTCRQMGYTSAESFRPSSSKTNEKSWKIDIQPVCSAAEGVLVSYPCLTDCMNHSSYTSQDSCEEPEMHFIELTCQFSNPEKVFRSSGNQFICPIINVAASNVTAPASAVIDIRIFYSVTGVLVLISMILLVIVIVQCCRKRKAVEDDNNPAQPNRMFQWLRGRRANYGAVAERDN